MFKEDVDIVQTIVDDSLSYIPWGGAKVVGRQASGAYLLRKGRFFFEAPPETTAGLLPYLDWLVSVPTAPVPTFR